MLVKEQVIGVISIDSKNLKTFLSQSKQKFKIGDFAIRHSNCYMHTVLGYKKERVVVKLVRYMNNASFTLDEDDLNYTIC